MHVYECSNEAVMNALLFAMNVPLMQYRCVFTECVTKSYYATLGCL